MLFGRRRWDPQPTTSATVLLASSGSPFSRAAVRRARELAGGGPVAVLSILKVYGSQFGLPNPGLLPSRREREEQLEIVQRAITDLEGRGCTADPDDREGSPRPARPLRGHGRPPGHRRAPGHRG